MATDLSVVNPEDILTHIANGGNLKDLTILYECSFKDIYRRLHDSDPDGQKLANAIKIAEAHDRDMVVKELRSTIKSLPSDIFNDDMTLKPVSSWSSESKAAINGIEIGKLGTKVKFNDKLKAIELLGKERGMFNKQSIDVSVSLEKLVSDSWKVSKEDKEGAIDAPKEQ